jgi:EmrB/QacA subfamily drug resistance transporter
LPAHHISTAREEALTGDPRETLPLTETVGSRHFNRRQVVLIVLCVGQMMVIIDNTVVNVALPAIQHDLHFSSAGLSWVVDAYLITFGGFLLLAGRLGDLLGRKRVLLAGLVLFTAASLMCGVSSSAGLLVTGRFIQGIGAAAVSATCLGLIATLFPTPTERGRATATYSFVAISGGSIGLLLGGVVVEAVSWHWIFFINLPIGIGAFVASSILVEDHVGLGIREGADVTGAILITLAPMLAVYGLVTVEQHGWSSAITICSLAGALVSTVLFIALEARLRHPLIRLSIFRKHNLAVADLIRGLFGVGVFGIFYLGVLYFQEVRGYSAVVTGLAYLPFTLTSSSITLFVTARLMHRIGAKKTMLTGLFFFTVGLVVWTQIPAGGSYAIMILPALLVGGLGGGLTSAPNITLGMTDVSPDDAGLASGLVSVALQMGGAIGVAVLATLSTTKAQTLIAAGVPHHIALTAGFRLAYVVTAGCMMVAFGLALAIRTGSGQPSDQASPAAVSD